MKIDTTIVDSYLESKDVKKYESLWLYDFKTERGIKTFFNYHQKVQINEK